MFWNARGINSFYDIRDKVRNEDIVFICETWLTTMDKSNFLSRKPGMEIILSPAVKTEKFGRPKGGLLILWDSRLFKVNIIKSTSQYIIIKINVQNRNLIAGIVYLNPNSDIVKDLSELNDTINVIKNQYPNLPFYLGGDFNSRVSDLNQINNEIEIENINVSNERKNLDIEINNRGFPVVLTLNMFLSNNEVCIKYKWNENSTNEYMNLVSSSINVNDYNETIDRSFFYQIKL